MKLPGSIASGGNGGGSVGVFAFKASLRCDFHSFSFSLAVCRRVSCLRCDSAMASALSCSIWSSVRRGTLSPGVLRSPEAATRAVHSVSGVDQDLDGCTRRAVPMREEATPSKGSATWSTNTPAPVDVRLRRSCQGGGEHFYGEGRKLPTPVIQHRPIRLRPKLKLNNVAGSARTHLA
jgi:hypothetical protein